MDEVDLYYRDLITDLMGVKFTNKVARDAIRYNLRIGQAFFLRLSEGQEEWVDRSLAGTLFDPFHKDTWLSCWKAIDYLTCKQY
jgi:hypothetical protein